MKKLSLFPFGGGTPNVHPHHHASFISSSKNPKEKRREKTHVGGAKVEWNPFLEVGAHFS